MQTAKQALASKHNWHSAILIGNIGSIIRVALDLRQDDVVEELKYLQQKLQHENKKQFAARKAKLCSQ